MKRFVRWLFRRKYCTLKHYPLELPDSFWGVPCGGWTCLICQHKDPDCGLCNKTFRKSYHCSRSESEIVKEIYDANPVQWGSRDPYRIAERKAELQAFRLRSNG